jgi:hypothetical protein
MSCLKKGECGVPSGKERYEELIEYVCVAFTKVFGNDVMFEGKSVATEHMGFFQVKYKHFPTGYDIIFENDRDVFEIEIYDSEGARNSLFRIEKYNSALSKQNVMEAIRKLKKVLEKDICFYISQGNKLYKKYKGEYKRVKNINELR